MVTKTQRLDDLFGRWPKPSNGFAKDGIIDETAWNDAPRKVLFLLKDTNACPQDFRAVVRGNPWKVVGHWAYGIQNVEQHHIPSFAEAEGSFEAACAASAIVNLKKQPGTSSSNLLEVEAAARADLCLIREELAIIEPEVIVCGGTFRIVKKVFPEFQSIEPSDPDGKCYVVDETVWIDYCHPSARYRHDMMYYTLTAFYRNYLAEQNQSAGQ